MKDLILVRDSAFTTLDGEPSSNLLDYENYGKRYLDVFESVTVVGRLFNKEDPHSKHVAGPGVGFVPLRGFHGPLGFIKSAPSLLRAVLVLAKPGRAYVLRIPATAPMLLGLVLAARKIPFAVEVAADPLDGYSRSSLNGNLFAPIFQKLFVAATKWICRRAYATSYVTDWSLQQRYKPGRPERSFSFTSLDLKDDAFVALPRRSTSFRKDRPKLVLVGNMQKSFKGHDVLLHAAAELVRRGLQPELVFVGYGENLERYLQLTKGLGLERNVRFVGRLQAGEEIRKVLDDADLFVLPSRQEGLPRALLEAMARGLPAIATRVGGTPELLPQEALVEPEDRFGLADKIEIFLQDADRLANESARNLVTASKYKFEVVQAKRVAFMKCVANSVTEVRR